jgi:hypothetical protein
MIHSQAYPGGFGQTLACGHFDAATADPKDSPPSSITEAESSSQALACDHRSRLFSGSRTDAAALCSGFCQIRQVRHRTVSHGIHSSRKQKWIRIF